MHCPDSFRKMPALVLGLFLGVTGSLLHAGSVIQLKGRAETDGKLSITPTGLQIETGASPEDVNMEDILEASFSETPFQIDCFSSRLNPDQLPLNWKAQDVGDSPTPGKMTYAKGTLTLTGSGSNLQRDEKADQFYVAGQTWSGNGQFSAHLKSIDPSDSSAETGPMERDSIDPNAPMFAMGISVNGGGLYLGRGKAGDHVGWTGFPVEIPTWFRMTRQGGTLECELSTDGKKWNIANMGVRAKTDSPPWIGLFVNSRADKGMATATFDDLLLKPLQAEPGVLPMGVLLSSGSFLAGGVDFLNSTDGMMTHAGKGFHVTSSQIAAVIANSVTPSQLAAENGKTGLLLRNGDFLEADLTNVQGTYFQGSSIELGLLTYWGDTVCAFTLQPVKPIASDYEVRLKDGSILRAKELHQDQDQIAIDDISGLTIHVNPSEIAQLRAGSTRVQNLIDLAWKTKSPAAATDTASSTDQPAIETWQGPNQEQILVARAGTAVDFPLTDKFNGLTLQIALSPDSPPNAQIILHILADGHEVGITTPIRAGENPRLINLKLQDPKTLTLQIESATPDARLLLIDLVAIRDK